MSDRSAAGRTSRARGTQRENAVAALMREGSELVAECYGMPFVVASMRQALGGGDLMAVRVIDANTYDELYDVRLVEVKSTARPFSHFLPADRRGMLEVAERAGATAWLAHWPKNGKLIWIPSSEWPRA